MEWSHRVFEVGYDDFRRLPKINIIEGVHQLFIASREILWTWREISRSSHEILWMSREIPWELRDIHQPRANCSTPSPSSTPNPAAESQNYP
ncbi:MAG TPA: hypothetical protein VK097_07900 [Lentibacillus sp.]|uniref:hypothetical protein n=1 Tax=Lentibacillus sp. TaxID=1925746 RepID=UPI002B4B2481|nr:hypothetical protein [Lentibacillus sp.]HLR62350.1 hypothetical protein [Lentibacillus sp.]